MSIDFLRSGLLLAVFLLPGSGLSAQKPEEPPAKPEKLKPLPPSERNKVPVSPEQIKEQAEEKLAAIAGKMKAVEDKLAKQDTGKPTQEEQAEIIKRLDELIQMAEQSQQNPPPQQNQNPQQNPEQNPENQPEQNPEQQPMNQEQPQPQPRPMPEQQPQEEPMETEADNGPRKQDDNAAESTENVEKTEAEQKAAEAARQNRINAVWGHLPPGIRQKILNAGSEKSLPQYEELNRKYRDSLIKNDQ